MMKTLILRQQGLAKRSAVDAAARQWAQSSKLAIDV